MPPNLPLNEKMMPMEEDMLPSSPDDSAGAGAGGDQPDPVDGMLRDAIKGGHFMVLPAGVPKPRGLPAIVPLPSDMSNMDSIFSQNKPAPPATPGAPGVPGEMPPQGEAPPQE